MRHWIFETHLYNESIFIVIFLKVEEFYKKKHNGRKLQWNHLMSNGLITMDNDLGRYDLEVTTFQMAVLYAWNSRRHDRISFESLRLATGLPENELRRTVWVSLVMFQNSYSSFSISFTNFIIKKYNIRISEHSLLTNIVLYASHTLRYLVFCMFNWTWL